MLIPGINKISALNLKADGYKGIWFTLALRNEKRFRKTSKN
jgi:hypothetical protein